MLAMILDKYGQEQYLKISKELGQGEEIWDKYKAYLEQKKQEGETANLFDYIEANFDISTSSGM